ncbi:GNAT family N-acetyltransferase [Pseudonocardia sp. N23]|uniref:GNAT family N-acetyltransferase n=1 Tax=Pseudonocardia sp. N23 TaxID=1987376 RepID=UPI000BFD3F00|nr:GNAT family protein [Pseudonocardia sp. N23]GAY09172.1 acetyltransferase including N-acetylases of ribosomal protein [Pseudonocardia sp. N23]
MALETDAPPDPWPLRHLVLRTPRLDLRPDDDSGLDDLVAVAHRGVHPPEQMPFHVPWTDADPRYLGRGMLQHFWQQRSVLAPENWALHFLVRVEGRVVGVQTLRGKEFAARRTVDSGSWLGMEVQGRGIGTEMRAAVLAFAFDHLGATRATSAAFADNGASLRVSDKLGYRRTGTATVVRRGEPFEEVQVAITASEFVRPPWSLAVEGYPACAGLLGAGAPA